MKYVPIKDVIADKISGEWGEEAIDGKGVVVIRTANFLNSGKINFSNLVRREVDKKKVVKKRLVSGDIIIEKSGGSPTQPVGRVVIFKSPDNDTYLCNNFTSILRPKTNEVHPDYLFYVLHNNHKNGRTLRHQNRTTGIINLKLDSYLDSEIPLPPFDDQIRIAHLLGKVEGLIAQRKQHLQQLDDLLKSVFLEMFGDPVRNERGWEKQLFSSLFSSIESGKSPKCEARPAVIGEWGVLKLAAVTSCTYKDGENKALPANEPPSIRDEVKVGDLLFSRKNTYELVAACAYVFETRPKLLMPDLIFRLVFREDVAAHPIYIWKLLTTNSQRKLIQSLAGGAAGSMPNISKANLRNVLLPIPPLTIQNEFAAIVEKVERIKAQLKQSLTDLEALYGTLSQKAFKGELDLSRVPLPAAQAPQTDQSPLPKDIIPPTDVLNLVAQNAPPESRSELLA